MNSLIQKNILRQIYKFKLISTPWQGAASFGTVAIAGLPFAFLQRGAKEAGSKPAKAVALMMKTAVLNCVIMIQH